ncbi:hypothetical protein JC606_17900 [Vibrio sp. IB15]|uniref:hypothetical protein n=1 Tax=Vibrio sp. IB15 TaxID=2779368 RepID=UPI0018E87F99|nr:hypothetical protein [Vibrio sp. IB15]MBJ2148234.1 hypothetical protein [Vibrio sp. IB15]
MVHGALSPLHLKDACFLVGQVFGVPNLGHLLFEITLIESKAGQKKSRYGGVCSVSHYQFKLMQNHHRFYAHRKQILSALGMDLKSIKFEHLANNPTLSLIVTGAWILANVYKVPNERADRAHLFSKWWRSLDIVEYMRLTYFCSEACD